MYLYLKALHIIAVIAWAAGIGLALQDGWLAATWFWLKFILVVALTVLHGLLGHWANHFRRDRNRHPQKFYRIVNEIPTMLMIMIVLLATVKPF